MRFAFYHGIRASITLQLAKNLTSSCKTEVLVISVTNPSCMAPQFPGKPSIRM